MNETKENKYSSRYKSITYKRVDFCFYSLKICRQIFTYSYIPGCHIHVYLIFTYPCGIVFIFIQMTLFAFYGHNKASTSDFRLTNVNQWYIIWLGISGTPKILFLRCKMKGFKSFRRWGGILSILLILKRVKWGVSMVWGVIIIYFSRIHSNPVDRNRFPSIRKNYV